MCIDVLAFACLQFMSEAAPFFALAGGFLVGFGMVIVFSTTTALSMTSVNAATQNLVSSLFIICINAGQFLNPYWGSFLGSLMGGDGAAQPKVLGSMIVLAICAVVAFVAAGRVGGKKAVAE